MRLISTDALLRLLGLREGLEDPALVPKIHATLFPKEFTKLVTQRPNWFPIRLSNT